MDHEKLNRLWPGGSENGIDGARRRSPDKPALRHGAYASGLMVCRDDCPVMQAHDCPHYDAGATCAPEQERYDRFREIYRKLVIEDGVMDLEVATPLIHDVVLRMLRYERLQVWAAIMPMVKPADALEQTFDIQAGHLALDKFAQSWERGLELLGLSRAARAEIEAARAEGQAQGFAAAVIETQKQIRGEVSEADDEIVDAEFEDEK